MKLTAAAIAFSLLFFLSCNNNSFVNDSAGVVVSDSGKQIIEPVSLNTDSSTNYIYLTFDDGPMDGSEEIDSLIRFEQIKANVFVVGQHALANGKMRSYYQKYEANPFIEIGNHSYSHAHSHYKKFYSSPDSVVADFSKCQMLLSIPKKYARQPGRNQWRLNNYSFNDISSGAKSADLLFKNGYKVFGWDVEWQHDPKTGEPLQSVDKMVSIIERKLDSNETVRPRRVVVLLHDEMFRNGREDTELKQLIEKLKAKSNYRFDHLSNYPG